MWRVGRLGLCGLVDGPMAWAVVGEERDARFGDGRAVVVGVCFEEDFSRRVEEDVEVRREDDEEA